MTRKPRFEDPTFEEASDGSPSPPQASMGRTASSLAETLRRHEGKLMAMSGVKGVGEGQNPSGDPAIVVFVTHSYSGRSLPSQLDGIDVVPITVGEVDAYSI